MANMTLIEAAQIIREAARRIPLGGQITILDGHKVNGHYLAMHMAKTLEDIACQRDVYWRLCDEKPREVEEWTS